MKPTTKLLIQSLSNLGWQKKSILAKDRAWFAGLFRESRAINGAAFVRNSLIEYWARNR